MLNLIQYFLKIFKMQRSIIRELMLSIILSITSTQSILADEDIKDSIINALTSLNCETQGVGDLLRSEFSHTCIPAPFFTFLVANIVAPLTYSNTMLRLKINDDDLFPGACERKNRIDPDDPMISFALCSNIKLTAVRAGAVGMSVLAIAKAMLTGEDPWNDIKNAWTIPKELYHNKFSNKREGDWDVMFDIGVPPVIPWKVIKENDRMCVATTTITFGWIPVGCKYIREPHPKSIYASFMDLDAAADDSTLGNDAAALTRCSQPGGCYQRAYNNSKTGIVITSPIIECIREMLVRILISKDVCSFDDITKVINTTRRETSSLFQFQRNMHQTVMALLTIYVVLYGFKIVLTGDVPPKADMVNFVLKLIFVVYFSVGINIQAYNNSDLGRLDGMVQWAFPFLLNGMQQIANWVMSASPSELCKFNSSDYLPSMTHIALWDSLDCKVSHYLGLDMLRTMMVENQARNHDFASFDFFNFSVPPYYYLLIPAFLSGNMTLVSLSFAYPLLVMSVAAYLVNATVICMIAIAILGILSPLFVPMLLFEYTKGYFDAWIKLMLSFLLQPMVVVTFMVTIFSIYDFGFYGTCKYLSSNVRVGDRNTKIFYIDNSWDNYTDSEAKDCKSSLGFMINNPVAALYDFSKEVVGDIVKPQNKTEEYIAQFAFLGGLVMAPALFFVSPKLVFEKIKDLILALITACFTLYLMYHFSSQLSEFAADMTEGVSLGNVTIGAQTIFKKGIGAINFVGKLGGKGGGASTSSKGAEASDESSAEGGEAQDQLATDSGAGTGKRRPLVIGSNRSSHTDAATATPSASSAIVPVATPHTSAAIVPVEAPTSLGNTVSSAQSRSSSGAFPTDAVGTGSGSDHAIPKAYVAMEALNANDVKEKLSEFFKEKGIDYKNLQGYSEDEFSRYTAFSSDKKRFDKVKSVYEASLTQIIENKEMKGHEADYVNRIESMFSGTQKEEISKINDRVMKKLSVIRKEVSPASENTHSKEREDAVPQNKESNVDSSKASEPLAIMPAPEKVNKSATKPKPPKPLPHTPRSKAVGRDNFEKSKASNNQDKDSK